MLKSIKRLWFKFLQSEIYFKLYQFWVKHFAFNPKTVKAIFILAVLMLFLFGSRELHLSQNSEIPEKFKQQIDTFYNQLNAKEKEPYLTRLDKYILARYDTIKLFPFDPNTATKEELLKLGLTNKQAQNVINYRERGGRFLVKSDFRKLYSIRYMQYKILEPYILLPDSLPKTKTFTKQDDKFSNIQLFEFDPNTVSFEELLQLGFTQKQAQIILNLRQKGWIFKTKEDFKKLYVVSDEHYKILAPYIVIDTLTLKKLVAKRDSIRKAQAKQQYSQWQPVEINEANIGDLMRLGFTYKEAKAIINYGKALRGYYSYNQLYEVWGIQHKKLDSLKNYITVDPSYVAYENIKEVNYYLLARHPYISNELAAWIVKNRKKKQFTSLEYLYKSKLVDSALLEKLSHYFYVK